MTLSITLLGTGCPSACPERRGAAQLIRSPRQNVLADCGSGVTQQLVSAGLTGADIDALLITHYHTDHLIDFYQLIISSWHQGRERPWVVHAPMSAHAHIRAQMEAWRDEREWRIAFERRPTSRAGLEVELHEMNPGALNLGGDLGVDVIPVDHGPVRPAYGFHFHHGESRIVLSGDTAPCEALVEAASGADVLVHEVFIHREMPVVEGLRSAETIEAVAGYHTLSSEVGLIAARAEVGLLALTHFVPPHFNRSALLGEVRRSFSGPVIVGEDLMRFELPARQVHWQDFSGAF